MTDDGEIGFSQVEIELNHLYERLVGSVLCFQGVLRFVFYSALYMVPEKGSHHG